MPVECKIPRFVQFLNKDSSAGETNKTPGKLFLSAASKNRLVIINVWNLDDNLKGHSRQELVVLENPVNMLV